MLEFPDVSNHNGGVILTGAPACIAKATEGDWFTDTFYAGYRAEAAQLGIPFAAYHWVDTDDLAAQAAHAFAVVGPATGMMWDAEAPGSTVPRLLELTARYRALGGRASLVYLPRWWWSGHLGAPDLTPLYEAGLALISSDYNNLPPDGWAPYGGVTPSIWQFTSTHPFNGQLVDFNRYPGTAQQLGGLFTHGPGGTDMEQQQINWLYNQGNILYALATGADSCDQVNPDTGNPAVPGQGGKHFALSLLPFWARTGADVDEQALADALASNTELTAGIATAVVDEEHARLES